MTQEMEKRQEDQEEQEGKETEDDASLTVASVLSTMNEIFQQLLRNLLLWLLDEEHRPQQLTRGKQVRHYFASINVIQLVNEKRVQVCRSIVHLVIFLIHWLHNVTASIKLGCKM